MKRPPQLRLSVDPELIVDQFAGGGGASLGIELALGRSPDVAINHDPEAIALHAANHPMTQHLCEDVFKVDPAIVCGGRPIGLMWLSPDCKHFSKAKGGKPVEKKIRGLAWIAVKWARTVRPRVIILENVEEFQDWGPLTPDNRPCPKRKGLTFQRWKRQLENCGYVVEHRELRACDYGVPTIRKRLFLVARCDGLPIAWPKATHSAKPTKGLLPYRTAAECIDWSIPCPSIFERERPLAENTLRRIAAGVVRYVINAPKPFIVQYHAPKRDGDHRNRPLDEPLNTQSTENRFGLVAPIIASPAHSTTTSVNDKMPVGAHLVGAGGPARAGEPRGIDIPAPTILAKNDRALIAPLLVDAAHGQVSPSGVKRWGAGHHDIEAPLGTVTASGGNQALVGATLINTRNGERDGQAPRVRDIEDPAPTITAQGSQGAIATATLVDHRDQVAAFMAQHNSNRDGNPKAGRSADEPLSTITASGTQQNVVAAHLAQHNGGMVGHDVRDPVSTITGKGSHQQLVASHLLKLRGTCKDGQPVDAPAPTITAGGWHVGEVRAFLMKYYGTNQDPKLAEPLHTVTTKDRFGLVTVAGQEYVISDIGMRMLQPRELYRAQGFPDRYRIDITYAGAPLTKSAQVRMCGNSVPPGMAAAIIAANFSHEQALREVA